MSGVSLEQSESLQSHKLREELPKSCRWSLWSFRKKRPLKHIFVKSLCCSSHGSNHAMEGSGTLAGSGDVVMMLAATPRIFRSLPKDFAGSAGCSSVWHFRDYFPC